MGLVGVGVIVLMMITLLLLVAVFSYAAIMRWRGRNTRFDRFIESFVRAQGATIYPPSLRPDPYAPETEANESSRAAKVTRETPAETGGSDQEEPERR